MLSGYNATYELCSERDRLLKEKLDLEEKILLTNKLQGIQADLELEEKVKTLQYYVKYQQSQIENENLRKSQEIMMLSRRGLKYDYLNDATNQYFTRLNDAATSIESMRSKNDEDFLISSNSYFRPRTSLVQRSREKSCFQSSIDALTNELYTKQAYRENPWKLY